MAVAFLPPKRITIVAKQIATFQMYRNPFVNKRIFAGNYEPAVSQLLGSHASRADLFVNIGANIGYHALHAASLGAKTMAVEPDALNFFQLKRNLTLNDLRVPLHRLALGEKVGQILLFGGNSGASNIRGWAGQPDAKRSVPSSTLDTLLENEELRSVMVLIDVEGAELGVLKGSIETLSNVNSGLICVEVSKHSHHPSGTNPERLETFMLANSLGYKIWALRDGTPIPLTPTSASESDYLDFIFTKNWQLD